MTNWQKNELLFLFALSLMAGGCSQRSYIMSFEQADGVTADGRFVEPTALDGKNQTPKKVVAPAQKSQTAPTTSRARPGSQQAPRQEAEIEQQSPAAEAVVFTATASDEIDAAPTKTYSHDFVGNETEHIKFSSYDPFAGVSGNSFSVDLDGLRSEFCYPIDGKFSSGYGRRGRGNHSGVDLVAPAKSPIYAAMDGKVRLAKPYSGYGNVIVVRHANGLETVYAHNSKNLVEVGQTVSRGEKIALCGRTGRATTDHLHFEVRVKGQTINPLLLIDARAKTLQSGRLILSKSSSGSVSARLDNGGNGDEDGGRNQVLASNNSAKPRSAAPVSDVEPSSVAVTANAPKEQYSQTTKPSPAPHQQSKGIRVGDKIYDAPSSDASTSTQQSSAAKYHSIVGGDTLSGIAKKYSTTVANLCLLNNITKSTVIRTGKKLRVK